MTTPLFIASDNEPALETMLKGVSGRSNGHRTLDHTEEIKAAVAVADTEVWDPTKAQQVLNVMASHSLAIWQELDYAFVPGPAAFGRIITLHTAWCPPGIAVPNKATEMQALPGYSVSVIGGVGDPQFNRGWSKAPFSTVRHRIIASNNLKINGPLRLVWYCTLTDVSAASGGVKGDGALFFLRLLGKFEVFGDTR